MTHDHKLTIVSRRTPDEIRAAVERIQADADSDEAFRAACKAQIKVRRAHLRNNPDERESA
jgi:hypothetical protein